MNIHTPQEVISKLKELINIKHDTELASRLEVSKQSLSQYKNKSNKDLQLRIISLLLEVMDDRFIK